MDGETFDWGNFTPEQYDELDNNYFQERYNRFHGRPERLAWTPDIKLRMALIENAAASYQRDREDLEAWMAGGNATLMFADVCEALNTNIAVAKCYIRGTRVRAEEAA